jgi:hypothetical protein
VYLSLSIIVSVSQLLILFNNVKNNIEIYALKLLFGTLNIRVLILYRAPSGNFNCFLHTAPFGNFNHFLLKLATVLQLLYASILHMIIFGDINIH